MAKSKWWILCMFLGPYWGRGLTKLRIDSLDAGTYMYDIVNKDVERYFLD